MELNGRRLGWIEGIIDGEGCLGIAKNNAPQHKRELKRKHAWIIRLQVTNMNLGICNYLKNLMGGTISSQHLTNGEFIYRYQLTSNGLRKILPKIRLIAKERQRKLILKALPLLKKNLNKYSNIGQRDKKIEKIYNEIKNINSNQGGKK